MSKFCPKHPNQKMILLLYSYVCDACDGKGSLPTSAQFDLATFWPWLTDDMSKTSGLDLYVMTPKDNPNERVVQARMADFLMYGESVEERRIDITKNRFSTRVGRQIIVAPFEWDIFVRYSTFVSVPITSMKKLCLMLTTNKEIAT